ncbi:YhcN/YlaJ family sporulation lipoprotein [Paenibacillus sp.]|uniref:YhcN/YlaJ family sporulation lipoprotein n=1 Tax=Paenibacillus sp. TaxID=58172 RepID=UPI002D5D5CB0|nr:YhcN/YlaJ family sporulation lipoprotein [Paenibacillus sp.]HZG87112.1 YhcN/YlaJ family sporulation lipoprotein [Paenibacillus sp.]
MLKKLLRFTVIGASVVAMAACGGQPAADEMSQNGYRTNTVGRNASMQQYGTHTNRNLRANQEMARAIERIDGISRARVVMGETNAYVAVELNNNAGRGTALGGSNARLSRNASEWGIRGNYYGNTDSRAFPSVRGQRTTGAGTFGLNDVGSMAAAPNMYGLNQRTPGLGMNGGSEISGYSGGDREPGGFLSGLGRMFGGGRGGANADTNVGGGPIEGSVTGMDTGRGTGSRTRGTGAGMNAGGVAGTGMNAGGTTGGVSGMSGGTASTSNGSFGGYGVNSGIVGGMNAGQSGSVGGMNAQQSGSVGGSRANAGTQYRGLSGRIMNRTGMNGPYPEDASHRYMYNGGAYGSLSSYNAHDTLSSQVRARVESVVRSLAPNVRNVYVSADREFMRRLSSYSVRLNRRGGQQPLNDFNAFVHRMFRETDTNRYDLNGYDQRNRNGVTRRLDNSFDRSNPRHTVDGGVEAGTLNNAQAGTLDSTR